jgi:hypothetical protein
MGSLIATRTVWMPGVCIWSHRRELSDGSNGEQCFVLLSSLNKGPRRRNTSGIVRTSRQNAGGTVFESSYANHRRIAADHRIFPLRLHGCSPTPPSAASRIVQHAILHVRLQFNSSLNIAYRALYFHRRGQRPESDLPC